MQKNISRIRLLCIACEKSIAESFVIERRCIVCMAPLLCNSLLQSIPCAGIASPFVLSLVPLAAFVILLFLFSSAASLSSYTRFPQVRSVRVVLITWLAQCFYLRCPCRVFPQCRRRLFPYFRHAHCHTTRSSRSSEHTKHGNCRSVVQAESLHPSLVLCR